MVAGVGRLSGMCFAESLQIWSLGHSCAGAAALSHRHFMEPQAADIAHLLVVFPPCLPSLGQTATVIALLSPLPFLGISSTDCWVPAPGHPCAPHAGGSPWSCILLCQLQLGFREILEIGGQSSSDCLINTSSISGHPLTGLIYEGEQYSSFMCPVSEALLF